MLYPKEFRVDLKTQIPSAIAQVLYRVPAGKKLDLLRAVLRNEKPHKALIFTAKKDSTSEIARRLRSDGYEVYPLSSNLRQSDRERVLTGFRDGSIRFLVATDVAARGIDIDDISHVINFDLPMEAGDYVHRIGRTGRVERSGRAISLVEPRDMPTVRDIERLIGVSFAIEALPGFQAPGAVGKAVATRTPRAWREPPRRGLASGRGARSRHEEGHRRLGAHELEHLRGRTRRRIELQHRQGRKRGERRRGERRKVRVRGCFGWTRRRTTPPPTPVGRIEPSGRALVSRGGRLTHPS